MNRTEKKTFETLSKKEQDEVIGGEDLNGKLTTGNRHTPRDVDELCLGLAYGAKVPGLAIPLLELKEPCIRDDKRKERKVDRGSPDPL